MPEVSSLVCACLVAHYIQHVIHFRPLLLSLGFNFVVVVVAIFFFSPLMFSSVTGAFCVGAHGWVALLCQSWGHYFNLGVGCQKWKPLDTQGTQPPV